MKIIIKAKELKLTPAITDYINKKIGPLAKFVKKFENKSEAEAVIEIARTTRHHRHGEVYYAEANLYVKGIVIRAEQLDEDIRAAIDKMKDTLKLELQKHKEKGEIKKALLRKKKLSE
ncbi:MAG: ribosome-associated translation inhibitor RaiA [Patescibacteria group bacterium]